MLTKDYDLCRERQPWKEKKIHTENKVESNSNLGIIYIPESALFCKKKIESKKVREKSALDRKTGKTKISE